MNKRNIRKVSLFQLDSSSYVYQYLGYAILVGVTRTTI